MSPLDLDAACFTAHLEVISLAACCHLTGKPDATNRVSLHAKVATVLTASAH